MHPRSSWSAEARLLSLFKSVGENVKTWTKDVSGTYMGSPIQEGNYPKAAIGAAAAVGSAVTDLGDYVLAGIVDKKLPPPDGASFGRLRRDGVELVHDVTRLKLLATAADVIRLPGSVVMDTVDVTFGFDRSPSLRMQNTQVASRAQMTKLMNTDSGYAMSL